MLLKELLEIYEANSPVKRPEKLSKFKEGQKVILLANEEEGWPEETGTVSAVEPKDMYVVDLDQKYIVDEDDDGVREVHASGMKAK
jgi:hypothetical protein